MAVIRVEGLSKSYRLGTTNQRALFKELLRKWRGQPPELFWALKDISFDVNEGDVVGVLGHNGAGKSTLLKILSQITRPTTGRISLRGRVASLLEVGTGFHQELTGRENVLLNGAILGMRRREVMAKFDEIVEFSQIGEFIDTPVKRYSTGMRVRLAFAVAAHLEPEILVIDEVLAVGDSAFQHRCMGKIGEVARTGRTVLFVSHSTAAVETLCTRGLVLDHGRLVFSGTQSEAIYEYAQKLGATDSELKQRTDRTGSGEVRLTSVNYRQDGQPVNAVISGKDLEIVLGFERTSDFDFPKLTVDLQVASHLGLPLFNHSNWFSGDNFGPLPRQGELICHIPRLPLVHGSYRLGVSLHRQRRFAEPLDAVANAAELPVLQGNFFGSGRTATRRDAAIMVDGKWRLESAPE